MSESHLNVQELVERDDLLDVDFRSGSCTVFSRLKRVVTRLGCRGGGRAESRLCARFPPASTQESTSFYLFGAMGTNSQYERAGSIPQELASFIFESPKWPWG